MRRIGTNETDKTPYFIYFSILILIFENIISIYISYHKINNGGVSGGGGGKNRN